MTNLLEIESYFLKAAFHVSLNNDDMKIIMRPEVGTVSIELIMGNAVFIAGLIADIEIINQTATLKNVLLLGMTHQVNGKEQKVVKTNDFKDIETYFVDLLKTMDLTATPEKITIK